MEVRRQHLGGAWSRDGRKVTCGSQGRSAHMARPPDAGLPDFLWVHRTARLMCPRHIMFERRTPCAQRTSAGPDRVGQDIRSAQSPRLNRRRPGHIAQTAPEPTFARASARAHPVGQGLCCLSSSRHTRRRVWHCASGCAKSAPQPTQCAQTTSAGARYAASRDRLMPLLPLAPYAHECSRSPDVSRRIAIRWRYPQQACAASTDSPRSIACSLLAHCMRVAQIPWSA